MLEESTRPSLANNHDLISPELHPWHRNTHQYTLIEYASLKQVCPDGVYLSLKPGNPEQWAGVIFVRKGPYAPAILRFHITFPPDYPTSPPSIVFTSDIFHPLIAPLTTYTYTTGTSNFGTVSARDEGRLAPGGFSLRHEFPHWFGRSQKSLSSSGAPSRNDSESYNGRELGLKNVVQPPPKDISSRNSSAQPFMKKQGSQVPCTSIANVLRYIKLSFDDTKVLDQLSVEDAGNSGAWKAWRAYRGSVNSQNDDLLPDSGPKDQDEWSWDGVWEERVRKGIDASIADATLYGAAAAGGDDLIRFMDVDENLIQTAREAMVRSM